MGARDELHDAVAAELGACADHICTLTAEISALTEREVLATGNGVGALALEAKGSLTTLHELARHFDESGATDRATLESAVRGQTQAMNTFRQGLSDALVRQNDATTGIVEVAQQIGKLVSGIGMLALDLGMLTINARIEAARWGSQGAAFATVASGMRELTGEVQRVNEKIGGLATNLSTLATHVVDNDKVLHALGATLDHEVTQRLEELREAYTATQGSAASAVELSTRLSTRVIDFSNATLTNLQFQDRMAQSFREIDAMVKRSHDFTTIALAAADEDSDVIDVAAVVAEARERSGDGVVRVTRESELNSSDRTMQSGVVDLF
jgi:methyl-accepting chemotaxis protein